MHALGVVHGDLALRNVTYDSGSGRVYFASGSLRAASRAGHYEPASRAEDLDAFDGMASSVGPAAPKEVIPQPFRCVRSQRAAGQSGASAVTLH